MKIIIYLSLFLLFFSVVQGIGYDAKYDPNFVSEHGKIERIISNLNPDINSEIIITYRITPFQSGVFFRFTDATPATCEPDPSSGAPHCKSWEYKDCELTVRRWGGATKLGDNIQEIKEYKCTFITPSEPMKWKFEGVYAIGSTDYDDHIPLLSETIYVGGYKEPTSSNWIWIVLGIIGIIFIISRKKK